MKKKKVTKVKETGIIYKATNIINGKVYIGKTTDDFVRYVFSHIKNALYDRDKDSRYFYKAIRKYGWDNFIWEIIDDADMTVNSETLNYKEIYWISYYKSFGEDGEHFDGKFGYNMTKGGDGGEMSEESKLKISVKGKGRLFSSNARLLMSIAKKGKKCSATTIKNMKDSKKRDKIPTRIYNEKFEKYKNLIQKYSNELYSSEEISIKINLSKITILHIMKDLGIDTNYQRRVKGTNKTSGYKHGKRPKKTKVSYKGKINMGSKNGNFGKFNKDNISYKQINIEILKEELLFFIKNNKDIPISYFESKYMCVWVTIKKHLCIEDNEFFKILKSYNYSRSNINRKIRRDQLCA